MNTQFGIKFDKMGLKLLSDPIIFITNCFRSFEANLIKTIICVTRVRKLLNFIMHYIDR
jgi:hypothetical protein